MTESKPTDAGKIGGLKHHFLVAMPGLLDPNFVHSVVYICEHNEDGAMGITINRPLNVPLSQIFDQFDLEYSEDAGKQSLLEGGPVHVDRGFVLHRPAHKSWESTLEIAPDVSLTASRDIIADLAGGVGPKASLVTLGYSGWGPGQLESELAQNAWLTVPADSAIIFDVPFEQRAQVAAARLGIDLTQLSSSSGHA